MYIKTQPDMPIQSNIKVTHMHTDVHRFKMARYYLGCSSQQTFPVLGTILFMQNDTLVTFSVAPKEHVNIISGL